MTLDKGIKWSIDTLPIKMKFLCLMKSKNQPMKLRQWTMKLWSLEIDSYNFVNTEIFNFLYKLFSTNYSDKLPFSVHDPIIFK